MMMEEEALLLRDVLRLDERDATLQIDDVDVTPGCSLGDNYMSLVTRVTIRGSRGGGKQAYSRSVVVKRQPPNRVYCDLFNCAVLFRNEKAAYYDVLPAFQKFSRASRTLPFPKCLHATGEIIVLEDLRPAGFKMADRRRGLDFEHCKLVFQELAGYHAMSLGMKIKDPEQFKRVRESVQETVYIAENKPLFSPSLENALQIALYSLRSLSRTDTSLAVPISLLEKINRHLFTRMMHFVQPSEPFSVITHGDCWINNILFQYDRDDVVRGVRLLDLQVSRYASPALDLLHVLYTSVQDAVRGEHFDDLLEVYHAALLAALRRLRVDEDVFTLRQLRREMKASALYGLINGLWLLPAVTVDAETLPRMEDFSKDEMYSQENIDHWITHQTQDYKDKIRHIVLEYVQRGFL